MNKYIVLSAAAFVISLAFGCQNCGYKTAHSSRYESLVGTTRLASPQTNCRYNTCNAYNTCYNTCSTCNTQMLANNGQFCSNSYVPDAYQNGLYQQYTGENASTSYSLLDANQQPAQSETPLRWRSVTEAEQQYANSSVNPSSVGVASALGNPAFGSPAPAPVVDPRYSNPYNNDAAVGVAQALSRRPSSVPGTAPQYPPRYPNSSPRAAIGVASALTPGRPTPGAAPQYPGQYPNSSRRATMGVDSALSVPDHPLPPQYSNQYPNSYPGTAPGYGSANPAPNSDSMRWRRVTEEEQRYNGSSRGAAPSGMNPGYGSPSPAYPNDSYPDSGMQEPLTVPVYPENNVSSTPAQGTASAPEIDPNALPMPESPTGTF